MKNIDNIEYFIRLTLGQKNFNPIKSQEHLRFDMTFSLEHSSTYQECGQILRLFNKYLGNDRDNYFIEFHKGGCFALNLCKRDTPYVIIDGESGLGTIEIVRIILEDADFTEDDIPLDILREIKLNKLY
jgi:hypothetical protein